MDSPTTPDAENQAKLLAHSLLSAARRRDVIGTRNLLKTVSANVQDAGTGYTPLHAAILGPEKDQDSSTSTSVSVSGASSTTDTAAEAGPEDDEERVIEIVKLLLENGAIWNDLDANGETPGCIAWRKGLKGVYRVIVEAGVRAEVLLGKLEELEGSEEDEDGEEEGEGEKEGVVGTTKVTDATTTNGSPATASTEKVTDTTTTNGNETTKDSAEPPSNYIDHWDSNTAFLRSSLRYTATQLLDSSSNAVMMDWESHIMSRHAALLLPRPGLVAMNIGHGMGLVDIFIQSHSPLEHHIVEAHPAVLRRMRETGWYDKPGVVVHEGRWQDVLPRLVSEGCEIDGVYYDTFAEGYGDLKLLFREYVVGLLSEGGRFGFYNGLGADRRVSYDVYTSVSVHFSF